MSKTIEKNIINVIKNADGALYVVDIAKRAGATQERVKQALKELALDDNIEILDAREGKGYRYKWKFTKTPVSDEIKAIAKELDQDAEDYAEAVKSIEPLEPTEVGESTPEKARFMVLLEGEVHWFADKETAYECLKTRARYGHPAIIAHVSKALNVIVEPTVVELEPVEPWDANKSA